NRTSPTQRNSIIKGSLVDPQCAGFGTVSSGCARVRTAAGANPTTAQYGTLRIRRKFTNTTAANVTTLRFRVVGITTLGSPGAGSGQADLRVISSSPADFNVTLTDGSVVPVKGTQVETPPAQPNGGGLNSTVVTVTTATPLAPGAAVNIEFTLGVQQEGAFRFFVNVEAITQAPPSASVHLTMGNPSNATEDVNQPTNYLMIKEGYALSYHRDRGIPNWTSWHLDSSWTTSVADRQNDFRPDPTLPVGFKRVAGGYNFGTYGFDRGHMVPSADRTSSEEDNSSTFLMTNMVPQASGNNQGPWNNMEQDIRSLLNGSNNEIYVVSGGHGVGGTSTTGYWESIKDTAGNTVVVPNLTWKVVMVMPRADGDDVARVNDETRTFAVIMPNKDNIRPEDWRKYLATVDQVEALTGYNFFSNVPDAVENVIEARLDGTLDTAPTASGQTVATPEDTQKEITLSASDFNVNNVLAYTVVSGPAHGTLSEVDGNKLTYTPDANYSGPDSFTFKANDGSKDSNTATVNINVTPVNDAPTLSGVPESATIDELTQYAFTAVAEDVDNATLTFSLIGQPAGAAINPTTGAFTWTPTEAQGGTGAPYSFTVRVSDGTSNADAAVTLHVNEVNSAPSLAAIGNKTVAFGSTLAFTASGSDADVPAQTLTYSLTGNVPAGATINPSTGAFSWTPTATQAGQGHSFNVRVTDDGAGNLYAERTVSVNVAYTMTGVLQPINADGSSVFKAGQTIPVKFQLTGASAGITGASIVLLVAKVSNNVVGTEEAADSTSNATEGNLFRYSDGQYIFNLDTKELTPGTYQLRIDAGDGVPHTVMISLR
ncbi:MAG TPA: DNA/RNA non-specific endonuclease, partial [Pyrinomonadaceae bacterium]|nr:DNA/RNA non-specific endonuclease [Pyrinomonadaceae bacterium]